MTTPTPQRFDPCTACEGTMTQSAGGAYVLYIDHVAALAASEARVAELECENAEVRVALRNRTRDFYATGDAYDTMKQRAEAAEQSLSAMQARVDGLEAALRAIYQRIPDLPITPETSEAATDALTEFCLMMGFHDIPDDAAIAAQRQEKE